MNGFRNKLEMQERDWMVLKGLFESRIMTAKHISALYFEGRSEAAKKRLQKLKSAKLIASRPRRAYQPEILSLSRSGLELLSDHGHLVDYPWLDAKQIERRAKVSDLTLQHELAVMDVKAAMVADVRSLPNVEIVEFSTWPRLYEFKACPGMGQNEVLVKPDGFIRVHVTEHNGSVVEHVFFLEVDRSTETLATLAMRAACYRDFYRQGGLAVRDGRPAEEFKEFAFRVLVVCKSKERRDNMAMELLRLQPPILTMVWMTTMVEMIATPWGGIWVRPRDLREHTMQSLQLI